MAKPGKITKPYFQIDFILTVLIVPPPQKPIPQPIQQPVQQQAFFPSFNYPAMVTEKEAIDWLRNGF